MRIVFFLTLYLCTLLVATSVIPALAAPQFEADQQYEQNRCNPTAGVMIISVAEIILNDFDYGVLAKPWAFDNYTRNIQVWKQHDGSFCAQLTYHGQFDTMAGKSPNGTSTVASGINGTFRGIMKTTEFSAILNSNVPTSGTIGTFDYKCNTNPNCPGYVKWEDQFFTNSSGLDIAWYGFEYMDNANGTWINNLHGSTGDIRG